MGARLLDMPSPLPTATAASIEARIRDGAWAPGTRLPPERELGRSLDVSRSTLRLALAELEERGLITRHQGRGTFVARPRVQADVGGYFSLRDALRARGIRLETRVLEVAVIEAPRGVAQDLGLLPGESVVRIDRLRSAEGEPLVIDTAHLPAARFPGLETRDLATRSLYDILREDFGRHVSTAAETLEPVILTPHECACSMSRRTRRPSSSDASPAIVTTPSSSSPRPCCGAIGRGSCSSAGARTAGWSRCHERAEAVGSHRA